MKAFAVIIFLFFCDHGNAQKYPTVRISNGQLSGIYAKSRDGREFAGFMGIPYADEPEKFEVAKPASDWVGIRDVSKFGSVCAQFDVRVEKIVGSEDCLFINVFTPNLNPDAKLPVLAFIHGGGYQFGNSDENGPDYLMDEDVVFVTFNYRLGAYGFLSTGDNEVAGNMGLKDQVLALKWIQKNIVNFGGNPDSVTLSGESAGGAAVGLHIVSPLSRGLFHRAISSSGTAFNLWAITNNPTVETLKLAERLNCPTSSSAEIKECLKTKTIEELYSPVHDGLPFFQLPFVPTVESSAVSGRFLHSSPRELYEKGEFAKIPYLFTLNEDEGLMLYSAAIMKDEVLKTLINQNWMKIAPLMFQYDDDKYTGKVMSQDVKDKISAAILNFYFSNQDPILSEKTFQNLTNAFTDTSMVYGTRDALIAHARHGIPTYAAVLNFEGIWSQIFALGYTKFIGMCHADDLQYLFSYFRYPTFTRGSDTFEASKRLVRIYTNFAKNGNPNIDQVKKDWKPIGEEELTASVINWMYIKNRDQNPHKEFLENRMKFWDEMYALQLSKNVKQEL